MEKAIHPGNVISVSSLIICYYLEGVGLRKKKLVSGVISNANLLEPLCCALVFTPRLLVNPKRQP